MGWSPGRVDSGQTRPPKRPVDLRRHFLVRGASFLSHGSSVMIGAMAGSRPARKERGSTDAALLMLCHVSVATVRRSAGEASSSSRPVGPLPLRRREDLLWLAHRRRCPPERPWVVLRDDTEDVLGCREVEQGREVVGDGRRYAARSLWSTGKASEKEEAAPSGSGPERESLQHSRSRSGGVWV